VIAGYRGSRYWGRDTMIALPGLTLFYRTPESQKPASWNLPGTSIRGCMRIVFQMPGETPGIQHYRCHVLVFRSGPCFLHYTGDYTFVGGHLYDVLADIVDWHVRARDTDSYGRDGLIASNDPGVQLTWMDARSATMS